MAEIDVKIKGDDSDLKRKFAESAAEAHEFAEYVKEQLSETKNIAADIAGEAGFGGIKAAITGGGVAVTAFGAAMAEMFKKSVEEAAKFETSVKQLGFALGPAQAGMARDLTEWVESVSGAMGSIEEDTKVFKELVRVGIKPEQAKRDLIDIQNIAKQTGSSVEEIGRAFAELTVGEIPRGFFRENLQIAALVKSMLPAGPPPKPGAPAGPEGEEESLQARVQAMGGAAWLLRSVFPMIAPGGMQAAVRTGPKTFEEQTADLGAAFTRVEEELGFALLPTLEKFVGEIQAGMPQITETVKLFAEDLREILEVLHKNLGWLGSDILANRYPGQRTVESVHDMLFRSRPPNMEMHNKLFHDSATSLERAAKLNEDSASKLNLALHPQ